MADPMRNPDHAPPQPEPVRQRVRVRCKRRRFSAYSQWGVSRRDLAIGTALLLAAVLVLGWVIYGLSIKGTLSGAEGSGSGPQVEDTGTTRF